MTTLAASKQLKVRRSSSCSLILLLVFFDEVQRAPEIFRALKINVDSRSDKGLYWLIGSQKLSLMSQVSDALPGRLMNSKNF
ncbi:MAG: AAA family ATPase [Parasutterella excrementihominis]|uniref:AAA family ATPase n=1 Tax=Parasutterella excrementihominis TaxID=487175 RepID=UPI0039A15997